MMKFKTMKFINKFKTRNSNGQKNYSKGANFL